MDNTRTTLLAPFFSSMAILSFKKKGKEGDLNTSSAASDLNGDGFSLSDLGGSLGNLSKTNMGDLSADDLDDRAPSMTGARFDNKRLQEIEATANDLKRDAESFDLATKTMKGEIGSMKEELSQINDSIRSLLNVYEAVSRQYNPFVENERPDQAALRADEAKGGPDVGMNELSDGSWSKLYPAAGLIFDETGEETPCDDDGPLDRIVRPDDEVMGFTPRTEEARMKDIPEPMVNAPEHRPRPAAASEQETRSWSYEDAYAMEQIRKLVDHYMSNMCRKRLIGEQLKAADINALDKWIVEFKRIGGV